tara:strand:- start:49 stop:600 length:552 start_codon:yes stop_codon:yes gene_type:complete
MEELQAIESCEGVKLLEQISSERGLLWEKIETLNKVIGKLPDTLLHKAGEKQSNKMKEVYPLKQHIEGGMYTREIFMPKGNLIVSMIHKQNHPSFLLKGKLSFITDTGEIKNIEAPYKIFTKTGTQRVLYIHEDSEWCCVYKTDATTFEEAEADVYTNDYRELPIELITKNKLLWQESQQQQD